MHEYSIIHALVESVGAHVAGGQVHHVRIEIGSLAGVDAGLLMTAYEVARIGTICAGATLEITPVDTQWACPRCERLIARGSRLQCPECELPAALTRGDEIVLAQIEVEIEGEEESAHV
jgi:hydrogenase nickel incorporation protein HypA/HybF